MLIVFDYRHSQPHLLPGNCLAANREAARNAGALRLSAGKVMTLSTAWAQTRKKHWLPGVEKRWHPCRPLTIWSLSPGQIPAGAITSPSGMPNSSSTASSRTCVSERYHTFGELTTYAYGVASTVGLMSMHIIGFAGEQAIPYAIKLGVALQLTNILRDIGEDWRAGRLYLPMDEMAAFGLSEADLDRGRVDDRWRALMRFQIERNRRLYAEANPGIALLNREGGSLLPQRATCIAPSWTTLKRMTTMCSVAGHM